MTLSLLFSPLIQRALAASGSDDFNRANSTNLGSQWTERAGDFQIYSNTLRNADTSADIVASFTGGPYTDVAATVQMQKTANIGTTTIGVRWGGYSGGVPSQGYGAEVLGDGTVKLWRIDDWTVLGSYQIPSFQYNQWITITLRAEGSTLGVDVNGVRQITEIDATYSSAMWGSGRIHRAARTSTFLIISC